MKIIVNKPCFVCSSTNSQLLFETEYPSFYYPGKFAIRKCSKCNLLFNSPRLPSEIIQSLLTDMGYSIEKCFSYGNRCESSSNNSDDSKLKKVLKSLLLRLGIFKQSKIVYRQFINIAKQRKKDVEPMIADAIESVRKGPTYLDTDDARDDLAKKIKGDNLLIVARKTS